MQMVPPTPPARTLCHAWLQALRASDQDSSPQELCQALVLFAGSCLAVIADELDMPIATVAAAVCRDIMVTAQQGSATLHERPGR